jgi:hypothetical protein
MENLMTVIIDESTICTAFDPTLLESFPARKLALEWLYLPKH